MRTIKLTLTYDGEGFVGWQIQPNGESVQAILKRALEEMTGEECTLVGAGRTDAGVHALGQVASFATEKSIPCEGFVKGLNSLIPPAIAVVDAEEVGEGFDARKSAKGKVYRYLILRSLNRLPLLAGRAWHAREALDLAAMREAAAHLVGEHDFESFRASGCAARHAVRRLDRIDILSDPPCAEHMELPSESGLISLEFEGGGFVRHMVRNIVGTLVEVGRGAILPGGVKKILDARERKEAGVCAPASGLYLVRVIY